MTRKQGIVQRVKSFFIRRLDITDPNSGRVSGSDSGEVVTQSSAMGLSAVWACTNLIAGTIGSLPLMVYRTRGDDRQVASDHPLYRLLHDSPNFDQTAGDFWEFLAVGLELRGNGFARKEMAGGKIAALHPIDASSCAVRRRADGVLQYEWSESGRAYTSDESEIFHIRGFGGHPLGGLSTLHYARQSFGLALAINRAAAETFQNGLRPSGVLSFKDFLSPENRKTAETLLVEKFAGAMNAGRPMILEGGSSWSQLSISPEDAQMLESRAFSVEEICRWFLVPPFMIGHSEKSSGYPKSLEQQVLAFQKFSLRRRLRRIEQAAMKQLLTPADRAAGIVIEFQMEGLLRGDSPGRASFYQSALSNGWMTINEVRRKEDLPRVEGGDTPRMQMQNVPITQAGQQPALPASNGN